MTENDFLLQDRITKIKSMNAIYDLENNAYISFSGGKDSTVLSKLFDLALPNNKIPRVFINTGIEYKLIVSFAERERERDKRVIFLQPQIPIKPMLEQYGYPFKSKEHSQRLKEWQRGARGDYLYKYIRGEKFISCPKKLTYQFEPEFTMKISDLCCHKMKKEPAEKWSKEHNKKICITGMRSSEGGNRRSMGCIVLTKQNILKKFHPLAIVSDEWENWFINKYNVELCDLYYPPYNFERTGCKGCPFNSKLQDTLDTLEELLPNERKQCEIIWKPVYDEYRRIGYRLNNQKPLFD